MENYYKDEVLKHPLYEFKIEWQVMADRYTKELHHKNIRGILKPSENSYFWPFGRRIPEH